MICKRCKKEVIEGANYCSYCGSPLFEEYPDGKYSINNLLMSERLRARLHRVCVSDLRELSRYERNDFRLKRMLRNSALVEELDEIMQYHGIAFYGEEVECKPIIHIPVADVQLKKRVRDILDNINVTDLYELTRYTRSQFHLSHNMVGRATIKQLEEALSAYGLSFKDDGLGKKLQPRYCTPSNAIRAQKD